MGYKAVLENEVCSQISGWRWQTLGWVWANISSVRIQRRMERTQLVLAVLEVLGSGVCSPQPVHLQGWGLGMGRELSSVCSPALFSLLAFHTLLQFRRWSSLLPPGVAVNSRWLLLHSKCCMRHQSMSVGGWLRVLVVHLSCQFLAMTGLTRVSWATLLSYWIIYFTEEYSCFFSPCVFISFFVLLIYLCVERLCFYVEKSSLIFLMQFLFFNHSFKTNAS